MCYLGDNQNILLQLVFSENIFGKAINSWFIIYATAFDVWPIVEGEKSLLIAMHVVGIPIVSYEDIPPSKHIHDLQKLLLDVFNL